VIIYKQVLELTQLQEFELPEYTEILSVQFQGTQLVMWYKFNEAVIQRKVLYEIQIVGTGQSFEQNEFNYICSVQQGPFVWHIFERSI